MKVDGNSLKLQSNAKVSVRKRLTVNHATLSSQISRRGSDEQSRLEKLESKERNADRSFLGFRFHNAKTSGRSSQGV
ncbi:MAG: hypothetical protein JWN63_1220 [Candidatus Acidoferrum typicum]|jgi:hypothetical protein|nr:hypothetical protein [Candidatus Acidoferrum typicum]